MHNPIRILFLLGCLGVWSSCYYDSEEELYGRDNSLLDCDTLTVNYTSDIRPIIDQRCLDCHNNTPNEGAASYASYSQIRTYLDGNKKGFMESITHTGSSKPMPEDNPKLSECEIAQLRIWIQNGYPEN